MAFTASQWRNEIRVLLADPDTTGRIFSDADIDTMRDKALRFLYKKKLAREVSNYAGTYTTMTLADATTIDFAMPTDWLRITGVQYWSNETTTVPVATSGSWDDRARPSYVRIYDAPDFNNYRIHLTGLRKWSGIDDSLMPDEIYDVTIAAGLVFCLQVYANKRAASRRNISSQEVTLGSEGVWYARAVDDLRKAVKEARKVMRPIGMGA